MVAQTSRRGQKQMIEKLEYKGFTFKFFGTSRLWIKNNNYDNTILITAPQHEVPVMMKRDPELYYSDFFNKLKNDEEMKDFLINHFYEKWPHLKKEKQMPKQYRLRLANEGDLGKACLFTDCSGICLADEYKVSNLMGLKKVDGEFIYIDKLLNLYCYAYVIEEIPQVGAPCEFSYGDEIEVSDDKKEWIKAIFLVKSNEESDLPYKVWDFDIDGTNSYRYARRIQNQPEDIITINGHKYKRID